VVEPEPWIERIVAFLGAFSGEQVDPARMAAAIRVDLYRNRR
jgi:hypothetical protein